MRRPLMLIVAAFLTLAICGCATTPDPKGAKTGPDWREKFGAAEDVRFLRAN